MVGDRQEEGAVWFVDEVTGLGGGDPESNVVEIRLAYGAGTRYVNIDHWFGFDPVSGYDVPVYFHQHDNYRDQDRTCFSSTCAMLLKWYKPESIESDDQYVRRVFQYGDTTSADVQQQALASYGLEATYSQNKSVNWLMEQALQRIPVAIGLLHRGPVDCPGGGHWVLVYGLSEDGKRILVHDPSGSEYNGQTGTYGSHEPGESQEWPIEWLHKRWTVESKESGWCMFY